MKNRDNIYNVGNDYFQKVEDYFCTTQAEVDAVSGKAPIYSDGLYHYTKEPVYELSGGESALNKRVFNKLPQSEWAPIPETVIPADTIASAFSAAPDASALFSPDYAKVEVPTTNDWSKTPAGKKD